jgi:hypothetical protein
MKLLLLLLLLLLQELSYRTLSTLRLQVQEMRLIRLLQRPLELKGTSVGVYHLGLLLLLYQKLLLLRNLLDLLLLLLLLLLLHYQLLSILE